MPKIRIGNSISPGTGSSVRVSYEVEGVPIWFESDDVALQAVPEALGSAFVIPCMLEQVQLEIHQAVCAAWYENVQQLMQFISASWGVAPIPVLANTGAINSSPSSGTGQFFSCGVDSFYTLLTAEPRPDYLIYVNGHGIRRYAEDELGHARRRLQRVADVFGIRACTVTTNIWDHPGINTHHFADTHSSLLAAVAHLMAPYMGTVTIPPTWQKSYPVVYGSHWQADPLWSSRRVKIVHGENSLRRLERVFAIAGERVAQDNLRVCQDHQFTSGNCSRCEKCIRTMVELHVTGKLQDFTVFDLSVPIWDLVDQLPFVRRTIWYMDAIEHCADPRLQAALKRLFRRSYVNEWSLYGQAPSQLVAERQLRQDYSRLQEGLENAMHHYELLQDSFNNLSADYYDVVGRLPIKRGIRMLRHFIRLVRNLRKRASHTLSMPDQSQVPSQSTQAICDRKR